MFLAPSIVTVHTGPGGQGAVKPSKTEPGWGTAVKVTPLFSGNDALQVPLTQSMPSGVLVTRPEAKRIPEPDETVSMATRTTPASGDCPLHGSPFRSSSAVRPLPDCPGGPCGPGG